MSFFFCCLLFSFSERFLFAGIATGLFLCLSLQLKQQSEVHKSAGEQAREQRRPRNGTSSHWLSRDGCDSSLRLGLTGTAAVACEVNNSLQAPSMNMRCSEALFD